MLKNITEDIRTRENMEEGDGMYQNKEEHRRR